jgi:hypothetical protein
MLIAVPLLSSVGYWKLYSLPLQWASCKTVYHINKWNNTNNFKSSPQRILISLLIPDQNGAFRTNFISSLEKQSLKKYIAVTK